MNISFVDTSIMTNLLGIPGKSEHKDTIQEEFWKLVRDGQEVLIMPLATIIETGNHIAHISDGGVRRKCADTFALLLRKTAEDEAPWTFYGIGFEKSDLIYLADNLVEYAVREVGAGDLSIVHQYQTYCDKTPGIGRSRIWTLDRHLAAYS